MVSFSFLALIVAAIAVLVVVGIVGGVIAVMTMGNRRD
jgi:hypothetical protein